MQDIVALNLDFSKEFGTEYTVKPEPDGWQLAALKLAQMMTDFSSQRRQKMTKVITGSWMM